MRRPGGYDRIRFRGSRGSSPVTTKFFVTLGPPSGPHYRGQPYPGAGDTGCPSQRTSSQAVTSRLWVRARLRPAGPPSDISNAGPMRLLRWHSFLGRSSLLLRARRAWRAPPTSGG